MQKYEEVSENEIKEIFTVVNSFKFIDIIPELERREIYVIKIWDLTELGFYANKIKTFEKFAEMEERRENALKQKFYIEFISFLLLEIELNLNIFLLNFDNYEHKNMVIRNLTFGKLINECIKVGLDVDLGKKIKKINTIRIDYIHNFLKKEMDYNSIENKIPFMNKTLTELKEYLIKISQRIIDSHYSYENNIMQFKLVRKVL